MESDIKLDGNVVRIEGPGGVSIRGPVHLADLDPQPPPEGSNRFGDVTKAPSNNYGWLLSHADKVIQQLDVPKLFADVKAPVDLGDEIRRLRKAILSIDSRLKEVESKK